MVVLEVLALVAYLHYRQQKKIKKLEAALQSAGIPVPEEGCRGCRPQQRQWQGNAVSGAQQENMTPPTTYNNEEKRGRNTETGETYPQTYYEDVKTTNGAPIDEKHLYSQEITEVSQPPRYGTEQVAKETERTKAMNKFDDWVDLKWAKGVEAVQGFIAKQSEKSAGAKQK